MTTLKRLLLNGRTWQIWLHGVYLGMKGLHQAFKGLRIYHGEITGEIHLSLSHSQYLGH
jgi:hypothetical protein